MKMPTVIAVLLIALGIVSLAYNGFSFTTTEKAVDLGPIQVSTEKTHRFPVPPIVGVISLVGGIVLLVTSSRKTA